MMHPDSFPAAMSGPAIFRTGLPGRFRKPAPAPDGDAA